jgi:hypothetical protein
MNVNDSNEAFRQPSRFSCLSLLKVLVNEEEIYLFSIRLNLDKVK